MSQAISERERMTSKRQDSSPFERITYLELQLKSLDAAIILAPVESIAELYRQRLETLVELQSLYYGKNIGFEASRKDNGRRKRSRK
ncbi:MAG: hypothetical protein E6L02_05300 [Thaumarchaeota archaeon]|nr:MAG: hypothetical protein E6L02_05300 [Nitrososphaerota archaeon]